MITNLVNATCLNRGDEVDAACLSMSAMEEHNHGFKACLRQKAMEEQCLVGDDRTGEEGEIAPREALYPTIGVLEERELLPTHHWKSTM